MSYIIFTSRLLRAVLSRHARSRSCHAAYILTPDYFSESTLVVLCREAYARAVLLCLLIFLWKIFIYRLAVLRVSA